MLASGLAQLRRLSRNAWLYLISNAIQSVSAGALTVLYTLFLFSLGFNTALIGLTVIIGAIGGALGLLPASFIVRRIGWKATLILSDVIGGVSLAVQLIVPTEVIILITVLGAGMSVALLLVVNTPFLAAVTADTDRTAVFGINNALALLGGVVGLFLGGFLPDWLRSSSPTALSIQHALGPWLVAGADARAYQLALIATGVLALPSIIPVLMLREPARAARAPSAPAPVTRWQDAWRRIDWRRITRLVTAPIGKFTFTQVLVGFGAGLFGPYLNIYFVHVLGASTTYYGSLTAILAILMAATSVLIVPLAQRIGDVWAVVITEAVSLPFLLTLGVVPVLGVASIVFLIRGPLMNAGNAPLQTILMGTVSADDRVAASGAYNASWQVMGAVGGGLGGALIAWAGFPITFGGAAALYAASIVLLAWWFGRPRQSARAVASSPGTVKEDAESQVASRSRLEHRQ